MNPENTSFHPLSHINPRAKVHPEAKIGPFVVIEADVVIGRGTEIGANSTIGSGARIGEDCKIFPGVHISTDIRNLEFWHKNPIVGEPFVSLGDRVTIGSGSEIMGGVQIGNDSWIGSNVTMYDGARIGRSCRIFPGAVISAIPQDLKFKGEKTTVEVGDFTTIRECVTLNRGTEALGKTVIGSQVLIMAYAHVAHDCIVGNQVVLANAVTMAGHVEVGDFTIIGGVSAIHQFVKIGRHVMISGGSLIRKDIPPFVKAGRNPLTYEGVNSIGLRRRGFSNDTIHHIQEFYRLLYLSGMNTSQAVAYIEAHLPATEERDEAITFVRNASRGIIRSNNNLPKSNPPTDPPQ